MCETCFDKLNEFIPFLDSHTTNNSPIRFPVDGAKMAADFYHAQVDVANESQSTYSECWSLSCGELSPTVWMEDEIGFDGSGLYSYVYLTSNE